MSWVRIDPLLAVPRIAKTVANYRSKFFLAPQDPVSFLGPKNLGFSILQRNYGVPLQNCVSRLGDRIRHFRNARPLYLIMDNEIMDNEWLLYAEPTKAPADLGRCGRCLRNTAEAEGERQNLAGATAGGVAG